MLQSLSHHIRECHQRAARAELRAKAGFDPLERAFHEAMVRRWRSLARSYALNAAMERFLNGLDGVAPARLAPWQPAASAPFEHDVRLAIIGGDGDIHILSFPARRAASGWIDARTSKPIDVNPSHWCSWDVSTSDIGSLGGNDPGAAGPR